MKRMKSDRKHKGTSTAKWSPKRHKEAMELWSWVHDSGDIEALGVKVGLGFSRTKEWGFLLLGVNL